MEFNLSKQVEGCDDMEDCGSFILVYSDYVYKNVLVLCMCGDLLEYEFQDFLVLMSFLIFQLLGGDFGFMLFRILIESDE